MADRGSRPWVGLSVLDPDPVRADAMFRELQRALVRFLEWYGCTDPEEAAAEAMYRGLKRLAEGVDTSQASPRAYIFGVAKMVAKEQHKLRGREQQLEPAVWDQHAAPTRGHAQVEARLALDRVLGQLNPRDRTILVRYCTEDDHRRLSRDLGVTLGNLRLIVHRIRNAVRERIASGRQEPRAAETGAVEPGHGPMKR
jgi:DNA-directed RNA polymerase specialized sigma24 family protein